MKFKEMDVDEIVPADYNPRKDLEGEALESLRRSILRWGCVDPLVWNERTKRLIGGHQRLKVLKEIGVKRVSVSVVDLDENEERALNLALNKIGAEWDYESLTKVIGELSPEMRVLTGFSLEEIQALLSQVEPRKKEEFELPEKEFYVKVFIPFEKVEKFRILAKENGWNWREL